MKKSEKIILTFLIIVMLISCILNYKNNEIKSLIEFSIGFILYTLPSIVNLFSKVNLIYTVRIIYYVVIFLIYYVYMLTDINKVFDYNIIICFTAGLLIAFLSLTIIKKSKKINNKGYIFDILFIMLLSIIVSCLFQGLTYLVSLIYNKIEILNIFRSILMMIVGTFIFDLWYLYEKITNTKLFITKFIEEIRDNYE